MAVVPNSTIQTLERVVPDKAERQLIQRAYRKLLRAVKTPMTDDDKNNIRRAFELAVAAHKEQRRKSGEPYIMHPIEVARICAEEIGLGPTALVCALLHDVVEDTDVTIEEIEEQFGPIIARIVDGLTKLDGTYTSNVPQAENLKKVLSTLVDDVRVVLIKMADRLHNMRTLGAMPHHKQVKIAAETSYIYAPLAHRLGLYNIKTELQDLCMKITEPEAYQEISRKLKETQRQRTRYINEFIRPLTKKLDALNVPYRIFGRPKSIHSIWSKIKNKGVSFEQVYDLFAVRIVVDVEREREKKVCWEVYSIVTDVHHPIPERLKDWITTPKSNGYESLHTTVIGPQGRYVEVQIRSERMDEIAEKGYAAHYKYKGVGTERDVYQIWLDSMRELLEDPSTDPLEFISDFKTTLFKEEVYVYTPKGDMRVLPKGATALDFAFNIHSEVGYHCSAAKVNGKLVPLGYKLRNGDQVEIFTSKKQKPNESWLKMVITGKARSKIRSSMKEERRRQGEIGRETLERKFKNLKLEFEKNVDILVKHLQLHSRPDLYYAIAMGEINPGELIKNNFQIENGLLTPIKTEEPETETEPKKSKRLSKVKAPKMKLLVGGEPADQYTYAFATCCNPVPGDDIFAFLTTNSGLKIHRTSCPNASNMLTHYGYRIMSAEWVAAWNTTFVAKLRITGIDAGPGVIQQLSSEISKLGVNIRSFNITGDEGYFECNLSILVQNTDQLNVIIRGLRKLDNITTVSRIIEE